MSCSFLVLSLIKGLLVPVVSLPRVRARARASTGVCACAHGHICVRVYPCACVCTHTYVLSPRVLLHISGRSALFSLACLI